MAFREEEAAQAGRFVEEFVEEWRPREEVRDELDLDYRLEGEGQSVVVFEVRPDWRGEGETMETPVVKVTYVRSRDVWKMYWIRADGDWHKYGPAEEVESLVQALKVVGEDEYGCFWG